MPPYIWGWIEIALAVFHTYVTIKVLLTKPRRRTRRTERLHSFKVWGLESTAYDRDDDIQS